MKVTKLLSAAFAAGTTLFSVASAAVHADYANMQPTQLKREATKLRAALEAGGGGAGPALPSEIRALAQCINTNTCDPYIAIAKDKIKAELAKDTVIPASVGKGALLGQLNGFIDGLNNGNLGVAIPGAGAAAMGGNPAANEVKTLNALKCAIDVAMVQKVNEEMDRIGTAPGVAQPIKDALMAVFAGH